MKQAQSSQFNWIFILVAGIIMLSFFIIFTAKFIELQNKKTELNILRNFDSSIEVLKTSNEEMYCDTEISENCLSLGLISKISLDCTDEGLRVIINDNTVHDLNDLTLFSEDSFRTRHLDFWIKEFKFPFYITKLIYLQPPDKKIYIITDEELEIPEIFSIEILSTLPGNIEPNSKVSFINKNPGEGTLNYLIQNKIKFNIVTGNKVKFSDGTEEEIYNDEMKIASVFSDKKIFTCNKELIKKQIYKISRIYYEKASILDSLESPECSYNQIKSKLSELAQNPDKGTAEEIENLNLNLVGRGCTELF